MENKTTPFIYDWRYANKYDENGNSILTAVIIRSDVKLSGKQALKVLKDEQERYKPSNYKSFTPVAGISHYAIYGWSGMYETVLFANIDEYRERAKHPMSSEPTGKYSKGKRNEFIY